ncbi:Hypothetical_protein [Hexamita inflata]|uniref:Hypothetical_protein n=1 Tax=Hexamita inflata TaxID=28002 RepID=A0AA86UIP4_9EUKA|nr:Hypothetical protein HINF_LOCUS47490 [Hexamita inflata]
MNIHAKLTDTMCTEVFKEILTLFLKTSMKNKTIKELCLIIDNLNDSTEFWRLVENKIQSHNQFITHTRLYYRMHYKQALFSERLNEADCQYLEQYYEQHDLTISEQVQQLMGSYFKYRDIFPYEVNRMLHKIQQQQKSKEELNLTTIDNLEYDNKEDNQLKQNQSQKTESHITQKQQCQVMHNNNKYVQQYQLAIPLLEQQSTLYEELIQDTETKSQNKDENKKNQEKLIERKNQNVKSKISQQLEQKQNETRQILKIQPQTQLFEINDIMGMSLSVQDKTYIQNFMKKHIQKISKNNLTTSQITEELVNVYFKEANIFISLIEEYVDQLILTHNSRLKLGNNVLSLHDTSSKIKLKLDDKNQTIDKKDDERTYKQSKIHSISQPLLKSLHFVLKTDTPWNKHNVCLFINLLTKSQTDEFWTYFCSFQKEGSVQEWQEYYFNKYIPKNKFDQILFTIQDTEFVSQFVKNSGMSSKTQITKILLNQYFCNRHVSTHVLMNKVQNELKEMEDKLLFNDK